MKLAKTINKVLCKAEIQPAITYLPKEDWDLIDNALEELSKMSMEKGQWGVIKNSYVDFLANTSFFCGVVVAAGTIYLVKKGVGLVKLAKQKLIENEKPE